MPNVIVLGAGLVGSVIARDLAFDPDLRVTVVDNDGETLSRLSARFGARIGTILADLSDSEQTRSVVRDAHLVIGAAPGWLGYRVLAAVIAARKPFVDISFMPEDARPLSAPAAEAGVVGVVDCGVAPGMSNVLAARAVADLDRATAVRIYVGGLPRVRRWPFEYAAVFSPIDVLEEYTRPARLVEGGQVVTRPALSEPELIDFDDVGTLEAFNTDGLRSLMWTLDVPAMREKTMRYPGHIDRMRMLRDAGFLSTRPVRVGAADVRPIDLTCRLLSEAWKLAEGDEDVTVLRVEVEGFARGEVCRHVYDLVDRYDPDSRITSMARTTGYPCAVVARMMLAGKLGLEPGVHFPEALARDQAVLGKLLDRLADRRVVFRHRLERAAGGGDGG
jgi:saccharopine dehydrogenase-like NADP-dependent oxidoreductase